MHRVRRGEFGVGSLVRGEEKISFSRRGAESAEEDKESFFTTKDSKSTKDEDGIRGTQPRG